MMDENRQMPADVRTTFDLSFAARLAAPLLKGACVYTIPKNKIKFNISPIFERAQPDRGADGASIIHYLRPYLDEIHL